MLDLKVHQVQKKWKKAICAWIMQTPSSIKLDYTVPLMKT